MLGGKTLTDQELVDAAWVRITADGAILLDSKEIARAGEYASQVKRIDPLFDALKERRARWQEMHPSESFPGVIVLDVDESIAFTVVKSAIQTATFAGYWNASFTVKKKPTP